MKLTALGIISSMLCLTLTGASQISITTLGPAGAYSQNFDGAFLGTGNYVLNGNAAANLGWYSLRQVGVTPAPNIFNADDGGALGSGFYNYGLTGDADRALGSIAANLTTNQMYYGLRIQNDTGSLVQAIRVQYTGEQWRAFFPSPQELGFSYQVNGGDITSLTVGTFTSVPLLDFVSPVTGFAGSLDGNLPANRVALDQIVPVAVPAGAEIMLRWEYEPSALLLNHGLAIDDVNVTFLQSGPTAAPVSISGRVMTASGTGIGTATLILSGGPLSDPLIVRTNPFGYYHVDGAPAGANYLLEVSSKRFTFSKPIRLVHAQENVTGVDFIADN